MDCLNQLITEVVTKLGDLVVESTVTHFQYLIQHKTIIVNLKEEHEKLKGMKQALQGRMDAEMRKGYEIVPNVQKWLDDVETIEKELQNFFENEVNKNKKCFHEQCPNLAFNYSLGKHATKKAKQISSLKEENNKLQTISYPKATPPSFSEEIKSLESRNKIITDVIEKLKDDKFKRISICGMGGVGKTTLVKELIQITKKSKQFDEVVMAVVSQNPKYEKIQSQIIDNLGLELKSASIEGKANELHQRLIEKSGKVLIVLDDLWDELNFQRIGIPSQEHQKGIKILFTSRFEKVCQKMGSQKDFLVSVLSPEEAWSLFREMAGDVVDKPDIYPIAKEVAEECGGLPLAIVTLGRALGNEEKLAWDVIRDKLRNCQVSSISEMQRCVYSRIEMSFTFLDKEQMCFLLLCGFFPEDFDIPIESLFRYGMGIGLFEVLDTIWKVRKQVNYWVSNLKRCFLLLDSDKPGCVKMHDVVRDVALIVSSREELGIFVQSKVELKRMKQGKWRRMSLVLDETTELENVFECPTATLELLQVLALKKETKIPWLENFIQGMSKLKVFAFQNLCIPQIPSLLQALANLHMLHVQGCDVGDISVIGRELKKLEILSFAYSNIKELPTEIGQLKFLRLLDLTGCDNLNFISTNVLAKLSRLEELYFRVENFPWMLNKAVIKELGTISQQLKVLEIKVRNVEVLHDYNLIFKNLEKFWVYMIPGESFYKYHDHGYLMSNMLQLKETNCNFIKNSQLVKKCEILILEKMKDFKNVIYDLDDDGLQNLEDLRLHSCHNIEYVIDQNTPCCAFPIIRSLSLENLTMLREILRLSNQHELKKSIVGFSYLLKLELKFLPNFIGFSNTIDWNELQQPNLHGSSDSTKLADPTNVEEVEALDRSHSRTNGNIIYQTSAKLFSFYWMENFPKLETILLHKCDSLEMVFDLHGYSQYNDYAMLFPQLTNIEISYLNNLKFLWGNFPNCVLGFQNLRSLTISNCDSLRHIFTSVIIRAITNLEILNVSSCKLIENIAVWRRDTEVENNKCKEQVENIVLSKLCSVSLSGLPQLVRICSDYFELKCPSLKQLEIYDCPMLEMSLLPTPIQEKLENHNVRYKESRKDIGFGDFKDKKSKSSNYSHRCMSFLSNYIIEEKTNKKRSQEISLAPNHASSIYEMKSKEKRIDHMPILDNLCIRKCHLMDVIFSLKENNNFIIPSHMKTIKVEDCVKLKTIVAKREEKQNIVNLFPRLESLYLSKLPNLVKFGFSKIFEPFDKQEEMGACEGDHIRNTHQTLMDESSFPNLTSLFIEACNKIDILFSYSALSSLEHLEKLKVKDCKNMVEIVLIHEETEKSQKKIVLPSLQHLVLEDLPELKSFYQGSSDFNFPSLEEVEIKGCPNMEVLVRGSSHTPKLKDVTMEIKQYRNSYIQNNEDLNATIRGFKEFVQLQESDKLDWSELHRKGLFKYFMKKSEMNIMSFHKLLTIVPFNEIQMLQHVRALTIEYCDSLTEVFETKEEEEGIEKMDVTNYELQHLTLWNLQNLRHIWKHNITRHAGFKELTSITIDTCHSLKSLLSCSMAKSLERLHTLSVRDCNLMEEIVTKEDKNSEGGNKVMIFFPQLKVLSLKKLLNLRYVYSGGYDYDIPLCDVVEDKEMNKDNNKIHISLPQLEKFELLNVPKIKCFCPGAYDYDIMISSIEKYRKTTRFPQGNVIVSTPNLDWVQLSYRTGMRTFGDINLTIHYAYYQMKYMAKLQKLENLMDLEKDEQLLGYINRETGLVFQRCNRLLNCISSNMIHLFSHLRIILVIKCELLEEIFESTDYESDNKVQYEVGKLKLSSLPKLKHIWKNAQGFGFQNLSWIEISKCHDLKCVFPDISIVKSLPRFSIIVSECNKMEEIIQNECDSNFSQGEEEQQQLNKAKIIFSSINSIKLLKLPRLNCFLHSTFFCYVELPVCRAITIQECPKMKEFCYKGNVYTPSLFHLRVEDTEFNYFWKREDPKYDQEEDLNEVLRQRK